MGRLHITAARHPLLPSESGARQHRLDQQAPASIGDVQRSCKGWPAGSLWREALSSKLRSSLVRERSNVSSGRLCPSSAPPFWRQHSRCTCGADPWRKASSSITCCTSQRSSVISLVCAAWQLAPHGQRVAKVLQLLRLRCWQRARTQQSGALHASQAKVELVFQCLHLRRICAEQGRWVPQTALVPAGAQSSQQKFCKLQRLLLRRQLGLRCQSTHPAFC